MHGFDYSIPRIFTSIRGIRIVVTLELISNVLHIPRVSHPDYPGCSHLKTVSKDELMSLFCETPHFGVNVKTLLARALQKVRGS